MTLSTTLAQRPDVERIRLRLGTAFIEHRSDLWPQGCESATDEWIRAHVDDILGMLELMLRHDDRDARRLPASPTLAAVGVGRVRPRPGARRLTLLARERGQLGRLPEKEQEVRFNDIERVLIPLQNLCRVKLLGDVVHLS